jgi:DNA-directed RNA polymerase subunit M/transcription elongation factor TFIIS
MKFCVKCDNMYYIGISAINPNNLTHYCRHCGHIDEILSMEGLCVLNTQLKMGEQKFNHIINPYTKMDPTLPRIYNVDCPNAECKTNKHVEDELKKPAEVIYMRYDDNNLKYLYICVTCDTIWKTDDH